MLVDELALLDDSTPCASLLLERLDERLEPMKVATSCSLHMSHPAGGLLDK
jgi:hypothetical protein